MDKKKINKLLDESEQMMRDQLYRVVEKKKIKDSPVDEKAIEEKKNRLEKKAAQLNKFLKNNTMRMTKNQRNYALQVDWSQFNGATELSVELVKAIRKQYNEIQNYLDDSG